MDYFTDVLATFLCIDHGNILAVYGRVRKLSDSIKNILICVLKMNKGLTGLERHKGELLQFFQLLISLCPICSHIFKTLNTISTTSVCCDHTINTICVVFTQYAVNYHVSKMITFSFHTSLPKTKIMDLFSHIYKCLNTACQKWQRYLTAIHTYFTRWLIRTNSYDFTRTI